MKKLIENIFPILKIHITEDDLNLPFFYCLDYYEWYYTYGKIFSPEKIMEIGVRNGYSAISIAAGAKEVKEFYLIDDASGGIPLAEGAGRIQRAFPDSKVFPLQRDSMQIKNISEFTTDKMDLIHIDGRHDYDGVLNDLNLVHSICKDVIILDDVGLHTKKKKKEKEYTEGVESAILYFLSEHKEFHIHSMICNWTGHIILQRRNQI